MIHFLRAYSLMDFGRFKTGRPPSPMWFSAYGSYAFNQVPVYLERADWSWGNDADLVGGPEPGSTDFDLQILGAGGTGGSYTWIPMEFRVNSISLIVQHTPQYWINFNLQDYYSGEMLRRNGTFHRTNSQGGESTINTVPSEFTG